MVTDTASFPLSVAVPTASVTLSSLINDSAGLLKWNGSGPQFLAEFLIKFSQGRVIDGGFSVWHFHEVGGKNSS